ncbi:MAG TPA: glycosyltransferase, partial [Mucilaginibacter sp.]|nr:glycosyltransferase [Mucilaginibacter sp.]
MPSLSLCMIVKNEEEVIARCLASVRGLVDDLVIVDTGSADQTAAICQTFGARLFNFAWCDDFSAARNYAFSQATGDYILWLDADDVIEPAALQRLQALKSDLLRDVYFLKYDYAQDEHGWSRCTLFRERIVKNDGSFRWIYPVHEVIDGTAGRSSAYLDITVRHLRTAKGASGDKGRNLKILERAIENPSYRDSPRTCYYYGRELYDNGRFEDAIQTLGRFIGFANTWSEDRVGAYTRMAQCYLELFRVGGGNPANLSKAREMARAAIQIDGRWAEPFFVNGEAAYIEGNFDEAAFWFKKCLRPVPDVLNPVNLSVYGIESYIKLMFCLDKLGDYREASRYNELALECKPGDKGLLYNRSYFRSRLYPGESEKYALAWYGSNVDPNFPTYRIRALQMHRQLQKAGFRSEMISGETGFAHFDAVIFFKAFNQFELAAMERAKKAGKQVVFDVAEDLFAHTADFPFYIPMIQAADVVTCCSHMLAAAIRLYNTNVHVVEDAVEPVRTTSTVSKSRKLVFGWVGMPENAIHAEHLRPLIEAAGCKLRTIHSGPDSTYPWSLGDWQTLLAQCDAAIAPLDVAAQPAKSNNKVTTCLSLGLPVVASPLDAYMRIIRHGINGLIATTEDDWRSCIEQLKNVSFRQKMSEEGLATARLFRPERIALKLMKAIAPDNFRESAVDIIIPNAYPGAHLNLCINSILACTDIPYNIIVVHNGDHEIDVPGDVNVIRGDRWNFSASINAGIRHGSAPMICILNDDVIVSEGWLPPLVDAVKNGIDICNPLSNCDYGSLHRHHMQIRDVRLGAGTNTLASGLVIEKNSAVPGIPPWLIHSYNPACPRRRYKLEWVPFYCTLLSRAVIEKTGLLDDGFNNGCEDVDFCRRAEKMGFAAGVNEESFVFHFGGTSTEVFIKDYPEEEGATHRHYRQKYALPLFVVHSGYSYEPWNGHTIEKTGIGGSETAAAKMAEAFTRLGYHSIVFCDCRGMEGIVNDVEYKPLDTFEHFIDRHFIDVLVISRYANLLEHPFRAGKAYFWIHDVWAMGTERGPNDLLKKNAGKLNGIFCLSNWHKEMVYSIHDVPYEKLIVTGNGIDIRRFDNHPQKTPNRFIYSSSPDR